MIRSMLLVLLYSTRYCLERVLQRAWQYAQLPGRFLGPDRLIVQKETFNFQNLGRLFGGS